MFSKTLLNNAGKGIELAQNLTVATIDLFNQTVSSLNRDPGIPGGEGTRGSAEIDPTGLYVLAGVISGAIAICCGIACYRCCRRDPNELGERMPLNPNP